jgi:hypothetical protein
MGCLSRFQDFFVSFLDRFTREPDGYARESHPHLQPDDEEYEQARNTAYVVVSDVVGILKEQLWYHAPYLSHFPKRANPQTRLL